ncbi:MAG: hypothetical protein J0I57_14900, partial [Hyphomicrobium sp.]|nr:hypothetical protein [Hyphomicrobium sp.]
VAGAAAGLAVSCDAGVAGGSLAAGAASLAGFASGIDDVVIGSLEGAAGVTVACASAAGAASLAVAGAAGAEKLASPSERVLELNAAGSAAAGPGAG